MSRRPAYQADGRPCSREAFYALACDPARSAVVQACAGAGKTWMLVSRILRALLDGAAPHQVLAITFTRKAAGEMRERLDEWLRELAEAPDDAQRVQALVDRGVAPADAPALAPRLKALRAQVLASGRGVQVHTFHAWFSQLMRAAPIELLAPLGLQPGMTLLEEAADWHAPLLARWRRQVLAEPTLLAAYAGLVRRHGRQRIDDGLKAALGRRVELALADEAGALDGVVPPAAQVFAAAAGFDQPLDRLRHDAGLRAMLDATARALGAMKGTTAQKTAQGLREALLATDTEAAWAHLRRAMLTQEDEPRKLGETLMPVAAPAIDATVELQAMVAQQQAYEDHQALAALTRVLLSQWQQLKQQQGLVDMNDLERVALAVLADAELSGWVLERLDAQVRHLLIDEFQDTSPLQWHALLGWLGSYAGAGGGASGQRPPSVFIVGDPKQSIYRFRGAQPRVFSAAQDFVVQGLGGVALACDHTRRNAPAVVQVLNQVFEQASVRGEFTGFRAHSTEVQQVPGLAARVLALPLLPRPEAVKDSVADALHWRDSLTTPRSEPREKNDVAEARQAALAVQRLMQREGLAPGQVMLLARRRATLALAAQALRERHIPCVAAEDLLLADQAEVADLVALLDVLASPGQDLSLARALRSPLFDLGDDDLLALSRRARAADCSWWLALQAWDDAPAAAQRARTLLAGWARAAAQLPPHDLLDRIVHQGEVLPRLLAAVPAPRRGLADLALRALLQQALMLDGARYATPYNFVRALKRRALKLKVPARPDAVQLLTVHGAKGLEAEAVFLLDSQPEHKTDSDPVLLVDWPVQQPRPRGVALLAKANRVPPSLQALDAAEQADRAREELNGLYVAITRARRFLVVSARSTRTAAPGLSWWSRLQALAEAWDPAAEMAADLATDTADAATPAAAAPLQLPRLPALPPGWALPTRRDTQADHPAQADLGSAVHRMLEWATRPGLATPREALARAAAQQAGLPPDQAGAVLAAASRVLDSPALAPFIDPQRLAWAGNEVPLSDGVDNLRLDRLVQLRTGAGTGAAEATEWWVLDYKLATRPQDQAAYREQMARYRRALQAMLPGEVVRAALVAGDGQVLELPGEA